MALKLPNNIRQTLDAKIQTMFKKSESNFANKLEEAGEILVQTAKDRGNYQDNTGDLRNSIGYLVSSNGVTIAENFTETSAGNKARQKAKSIATQYKGISLVVIAGMEYGSYVESQGYDVLTSAKLIAQNLIPKLLKE